MNNVLPKGWTTASIGDVAELNPRHSRDLDEHLPISFVPMAGVSEDQPKFKFAEERLLGEVKQGFTHFAEGDVLFAKITPCMENGKAAVAEGLKNGLGCGSTEFHVMRPHHGIDPRYVYRFIHQESFRRAAKQNFTGTAGQARVPISFVREAAIPLAPVDEQKRIVEKLERLLEKVGGCNARLERIPIILKRFRQSVLAAACSGRLTVDWREQNEQPESGQEHLLRIKSDRLAAAQSKKEKEQIVEAFTEHGGSEEHRSEDTKLPNSWAQGNVGMVGAVCNGSTPSRKSPAYWGGSIPWVSSGEVRNNVIFQTREGITEEGFEGTSVRLLPKGTVLLAMIGEGKTRGQTAILKLPATINQNVAAVVINNDHVLSEYLWHWFQFQYTSTREKGSGSGPQALNCQRVRELPFILPPLTEQQEIVCRVESLFTLADQLEARYKKGKAYVDKLTQSILAKAFRGELVPQDPNDEPAEKLLERIRAGRNGKQQRLSL